MNRSGITSFIPVQWRIIPSRAISLKKLEAIYSRSFESAILPLRGWSKTPHSWKIWSITPTLEILN